MSTALVPLADMERMAAAIAKSQLFGAKTPDEALAIMLIAQAEGMHPAAAARDYHIIDGKPSMKADAMMARYIASGGKVEWHDYTDAKVAATFSHPAGGSVRIEWSIDMAKKITSFNRKKNAYESLADKNTWKNYPRQMLRARCISEGVRTTNPAVAVGIYTPEEVQDFDQPKEKNMGAAEIVKGDEVTKAQLRRLEGIIGAMRFDREEIRKWCKEQFGKDHFAQLDRAEYQKLDEAIVANTFKASEAPEMPDVPDEALEETGELINPDQAVELERLLQDAGIGYDDFKKVAQVPALRMLRASRFEGAKAWIEKQSKREATT